MTSNELMEKANVSKSTFYKIKNGQNVTTDVLLRICNALDCDISEIVECEKVIWLKNIKANRNIAISAYDAKTLQGYQIKGAAEYITSGTVVDTFKAMVEKMFNGAATAKGAFIITPNKVIVTTPGAENKKEL